MIPVVEYKPKTIISEVKGNWLEDGKNYTYYSIFSWNGIRFATNPQSFPRRKSENVIKSHREWDSKFKLNKKCDYYTIQLTYPLQTFSLEKLGIDVKFTEPCFLHGENEGLSRDLQFYLHLAAMRTSVNNLEKNKILKLKIIRPNIFCTILALCFPSVIYSIL